jgi:hypothetical protein
MKRVVLALIIGLFAVPVGTTSASAAPPIDVNAQPVDRGVTVTVSSDTTTIETMTAGKSVEDRTDNKKPGLCASGIIHTSCTPASEAAPER